MWLVVCFFQASESSIQRRFSESSTSERLDYNALVCELKNNESLRDVFYADVRRQYGYTDSDDEYYYDRDLGICGAIPCYRRTPNFNGNVTWCVNVYNPQYEVKVCLNKTGLIYQSEAAKELEMARILSLDLANDCPCDDGNCLGVISMPYYFSNAYAVCIIPNEIPAFVKIEVNSNTEYLRIFSFSDMQDVTLGNTAVLNCSVFSGAYLCGEATWARNGSRYTPIEEDPFCFGEDCSRDNTHEAPKLRRNRVRAYIADKHQDNCMGWSSWTGYLIIDNVTWYDAGRYRCEATSPSHMNPIVQETTLRVLSRRDVVTTPVIYSTIPAPHESTNYGSSDSYDTSFKVIVSACTSVVILITIFVVILLAYKCAGRHKRVEVCNPSISMPSPYQPAPEDRWEFPRERLHIFQNRILGKGAFGKVEQARAEGIIQSNPEKDIVAVKTVKDNAPAGESSNLLDELELMKRIRPHINVINLLGCCTTPDGPICLIIEYAMHGNLKNFLRSCENAAMTLNHQPLIFRKQSCSNSSSAAHQSMSISSQVFFPNDVQVRYVTNPQPSAQMDQDIEHSGLVCTDEDKRVAHPHEVLSQDTPSLSHDYLNCKGLVYMEDIQTFALQIASGLQHLETMEIVHCDLAARNILISEGFVLKISDFGMARDISSKSYYRKCPHGPIPVKWTAPEALEEHLYTYKSDIWSFGIVLWEIFSYGHSPFPDMDIHTWDPFIQYLKNGNRPVIPDGCPLFFHNIMQWCWKLNPENRPSSSSLVQAFSTKQTCQEEKSSEMMMLPRENMHST